MPSFIDLFSGAGGFSLGASLAGWTHLSALDNWSDATDTYAANFPHARVFCEGVEHVQPRQLMVEQAERPDWIIGGPPCQGFSTVGRRNSADPRNTLAMYFARVVEELKPSGFVLENVLGLRDMNFVQFVTSLFANLGYAVTPVVLTSADYGVPQLRRRIFFVGDIKGRSFVRPEPTHQRHDHVTVWDAIGDLPVLRPGEAATAYDRQAFTAYQRAIRAGSQRLQGHEASKHPAYLVHAISHIPDGGNRRHIPDHLQPNSGYHNSYSRLNSKAPAVAVTQNMGKPSGTRCIHPFQDRGLTAREGARLQSFPDSFCFSGGIVSQRLQIANAVPPLLAKAVLTATTSDAHWVRTLDEAEQANHALREVTRPHMDDVEQAVEIAAE